MDKLRTRKLYLGALGASILGLIFQMISFATGPTTTAADGTVTKQATGWLLAVAIIFFIVAGILGLVAWVGAIIRMAQLSHWIWLACLIFFSGITMLLYIFIGPTTRAGEGPAFSQSGMLPS